MEIKIFVVDQYDGSITTVIFGDKITKCIYSNGTEEEYETAELISPAENEIAFPWDDDMKFHPETNKIVLNDHYQDIYDECSIPGTLEETGEYFTFDEEDAKRKSEEFRKIRKIIERQGKIDVWVCKLTGIAEYLNEEKIVEILKKNKIENELISEILKQLKYKNSSC